MSTNNIVRSDLYYLHNIVQGSMLVYPKELIIATLKDFFSKDSYYHYSKDAWGFANTVDHTDLPLGAGTHDDITTRIYIGESYRFDGIYYPAVLVKSNGMKYVPISINREQGGVQNEPIVYEDNFGNKKIISRPKSFISAGAWEGSISIDVLTRSLRARDDICQLIALLFTEISFNTLVDVGLVIKPLSIGAPTESDDRNDKLFKQTLSLDIRVEWRREIPIRNIIDTIMFSVKFGNTQKEPFVPADNLTINTNISLIDMLLET